MNINDLLENIKIISFNCNPSKCSDHIKQPIRKNSRYKINDKIWKIEEDCGKEFRIAK
jgi:hypothetical protein